MPAADGRGTITCTTPRHYMGDGLHESHATYALSQLQHKQADHAAWTWSGAGVPASGEKRTP